MSTPLDRRAVWIGGLGQVGCAAAANRRGYARAGTGNRPGAPLSKARRVAGFEFPDFRGAAPRCLPRPAATYTIRTPVHPYLSARSVAHARTQAGERRKADHSGIASRPARPASSHAPLARLEAM